MALNIVASTQVIKSTANTNSFSGSLTVSASTNVLIFQLTAYKDLNSAVPSTILGLTFNGVAAQYIGEANSTSNPEWAGVWILEAPFVGTANVVVTGINLRALSVVAHEVSGYKSGAAIRISGGSVATLSVTTRTFNDNPAVIGNLLLSSLCLRGLTGANPTALAAEVSVSGGNQFAGLTDGTGTTNTTDIGFAHAWEIIAATSEAHVYNWTTACRCAIFWIEVDAATGPTTYNGATDIQARAIVDATRSLRLGRAVDIQAAVTVSASSLAVISRSVDIQIHTLVIADPQVAQTTVLLDEDGMALLDSYGFNLNDHLNTTGNTYERDIIISSTTTVDARRKRIVNRAVDVQGHATLDLTRKLRSSKLVDVQAHSTVDVTGSKRFGRSVDIQAHLTIDAVKVKHCSRTVDILSQSSVTALSGATTSRFVTVNTQSQVSVIANLRRSRTVDIQAHSLVDATRGHKQARTVDVTATSNVDLLRNFTRRRLVDIQALSFVDAQYVKSTKLQRSSLVTSQSTVDAIGRVRFSRSVDINNSITLIQAVATVKRAGIVDIRAKVTVDAVQNKKSSRAVDIRAAAFLDAVYSVSGNFVRDIAVIAQSTVDVKAGRIQRRTVSVQATSEISAQPALTIKRAVSIHAQMLIDSITGGLVQRRSVGINGSMRVEVFRGIPNTGGCRPSYPGDDNHGWPGMPPRDPRHRHTNVKPFLIRQHSTGRMLNWLLPEKIDLTGATVYFLMYNEAETIQYISSVASIVRATKKPEVSYRFKQLDLDVPGKFKGMFRIVYADGTSETIPDPEYIPITIGKEIALNV